jgi:hypothetical protein
MLARHHEPEKSTCLRTAKIRKARRKILPNISCRHRRSAPSYQLSIVLGEMSSSRATMVAKRAPATFLGIFAMLRSMPVGAEEKPGRPSQPSLIVTPASSMAFSGPHGGPFSPARFEFRVSSTTGIVGYSIRTPSWLTASSTFGTTDTRGVTITLTVNANASRLSPGEYGPGVEFTNVSNGQDSTTRPAKLIIQGLRLRLRQVKSHRTVEVLARRPRRIPVGRPRWPFAGAVNWRTQTIVPYRYVCIKDNARRCVSAAAANTTTMPPRGLPRRQPATGRPVARWETSWIARSWV